jgi:hypothetical protein
MALSRGLFEQRFYAGRRVRALSGWRFSDGAGGRVVETDVEFKR